MQSLLYWGATRHARVDARILTSERNRQINEAVCAFYATRQKTTTRPLSTKLSNFKRGCLWLQVHESPNNVLTVWKAMIASSSVASFAVRRQAVWNSCSSVFMKSKVMERFKETRLVVCLLLFLTLCVDLGFEFGRNKDSEFTFLLPAGATECFFQTTSKNGSIEVEYQVNKIF